MGVGKRPSSTEKPTPMAVVIAKPWRNPRLARWYCLAPWFWATKIAMASQALMPKAWVKFSTRVVAVKAEMASVLMPLTAL